MRIRGIKKTFTTGLAAGLIAVPCMALLPQSAHAATGVSYNVIDDTADHVTADALPTVQIDSGVVWSTLVVGNTVFAGGDFSNARPAGAAAGTNLVPRSNLLAFDLTTGMLNTSFAPVVNGVVRSIAVSPDKKTLYIGGAFTQVNGQTRNHIAAFDIATGTLTPFAPAANSTVKAIVVSDSTVYFGGLFTAVNGQSRPYLAAATTAGALTTWAPVADYMVNGLALTPDGSRVIAGGGFSQINGTSSPGMASIDAVNATLYPFAANQTVQNYGTSSAIYSLHSDGTNILATGYWFGGTGNFEGVLSADPYSGQIHMMADCHGDSYDVTSMNNVVYSVSHHHDCSNINSEPQQNPWNWQRADSWTYDPTGTVGTNSAGGYHNFAGQPAPSEYAWFPTLDAGTYTGQSQAAWTVSSGSDYVVLGGEFPRVNGTAQYGLTRFSVPANAPKKQGPVITGDLFTPSLEALGNNVKVSWASNWDRDNQTLTYKLFRTDKTDPIYTTTLTTQWWNLPTMGYLDTDLAANTKYKYYVQVSDADGNTRTSLNATVTTGSASLGSNDYTKAVATDGATHYWRLTDPLGSKTVVDWAGNDDLTVGTGVTLGQSGNMSASDDTAASFDGTDNGRAVGPSIEQGPQVYSVETWIKTTTTSGGKIVGFGDSKTTGSSNNYDRHIYMDNAGHLIYGNYSSGVHTAISSASYNDGEWHHVVGTEDGTTMTLYVDGLRVARTACAGSQPFNGYWHLGGDSLGGWPNTPSSQDFNGIIDDTATYPTALTASQVAAHYAASGRRVDLPQRPTDTYGGLVYDDNPEFYWRLDEASGTIAKDATQNLSNGTYTGGYTQGQTSAVEGTSVLFNGQDAGVYENTSETSPDTYSEEAWFNTTTTSGGKIMGFGSQQSGYSGSYDRHVYLDQAGHVNFGVWTGQQQVISTPGSYNDGQWHHVVATQGSDGMHLYVDGALIGTNATTAGTDYQGYWRVGGDSAWSGSGYFNGLIDEAAVYDKVLTPDDVRAHYRASSQTRNQAPTASFKLSCDTAGDCHTDATASTDADGTIASYAWTVDGSPIAATESRAEFKLPAGDHTVGLTVTDDQGATNSTSQSVTVTIVNQNPVAAFNQTCDSTTCTFDGTLSSDPDGTVASYAWDFGDGTTGTGPNPKHTYADTGSYNVTLTVTDNSGATSSGTNTIKVTKLFPPTASFTATTDGLTASVDGSGSTDPDGTVASYAWDFGDGTTGTGVTAKHTYTAGGTYTITLTATDNTGLIDTTTRTVTVTAPNVPPTAVFTSTTDGLTANVDATGSADSDGTIASYAWDFGDGTTGTGVTATHTYTAGGTYTVTLTTTDNQGASTTTKNVVTVTAPNQAPTAVFTSTTSGLTASVDASGSKDSDGSIASYAWDFGDGTTGTGVTATHTYTAGGTYTVTLTTTDNQGASTTTTNTVTVVGASTVASDAFARTVASGWGTADQGGAWTSSWPAMTSVSGGAGLMNLKTAGTAVTNTLSGVSASDVTAQAGFSVSAVPTGNSVYARLTARRVGNTYYAASLRFMPDGTVHVVTSRFVSGTETVMREVAVPGVTYKAGQVVNLSFSVSGQATATLSATVWTGSTQPAKATVTSTDTTAALQAAGAVAVYGYSSSSVTNSPIVLATSNLVVTKTR